MLKTNPDASWQEEQLEKNYRIVKRIQADIKSRYCIEDIEKAKRNALYQGEDEDGLIYSVNSFLAAVMLEDEKALLAWRKRQESCLYQKGVGYALERKSEDIAMSGKMHPWMEQHEEGAAGEEAIAAIWSALFFHTSMEFGFLGEIFGESTKEEQLKIVKMIIWAAGWMADSKKKTDGFSKIRAHTPEIYMEILKTGDQNVRMGFPYPVFVDLVQTKNYAGMRRAVQRMILEQAAEALLQETLFSGKEQEFADCLTEWEDLHFFISLWNRTIGYGEFTQWTKVKKDASEWAVRVIKDRICALSEQIPDLKKQYADEELSLWNDGIKQLIFFRNELKPHGCLTLTMRNLEQIGIPEYIPEEEESRLFVQMDLFWENEWKRSAQIARVWRITNIHVPRKTRLYSYQKELLKKASPSVFFYAGKCGLFPPEVLPAALSYVRKCKNMRLIPALVCLGRKEAEDEQ